MVDTKMPESESLWSRLCANDGVSLCVTVHLTSATVSNHPRQTNGTQWFSARRHYGPQFGGYSWLLIPMAAVSPLFVQSWAVLGGWRSHIMSIFRSFTATPHNRLSEKTDKQEKKQLMFTPLFTASNKNLSVITFFETDALLCCKAATRKTEGRLTTRLGVLSLTYKGGLTGIGVCCDFTKGQKGWTFIIILWFINWLQTPTSATLVKWNLCDTKDNQGLDYIDGVFALMKTV